MSTSFNTVVDSFLRRIELDTKMFKYPDTSMQMSLEIAKARSVNYLLESCSVIMSLYPEVAVDFTDYSLETQEFNFDLSNREIYLLSALMEEQHIGRDLIKLKMESVNYSSNDIRAYSPDNWRQSVMAIYDDIHARNIGLLDGYANTDRDAGGYIALNYAEFDTTEGA